MSIAQNVSAHLPYLRRFARAMTGSQQSGDAYVVSTLEALVADPSIFSADASPRVGLYQLFIRLWLSLLLEGETLSDPDGLPGQRSLNQLAPRSRQAFLLHVVEGFSVDEIAIILDTDAADVNELLNAASHEIALQMSTDVLIIEDEPIIALDIEALVLDLGHRVTGIARTRTQATKFALEKPPGLVLADVQLADGSSGLDAVNDILNHIDVPVIFVTAFPELLLTGEKPEPAFIITKPFPANVLRATISQALFFDRKSSKQTA